MRKKVISLLLVAAMVISVFTGCGNVQTSKSPSAEPTSNAYGLRDEVEDGSILHCFSWSFETIEESLEDIAMAGYSAVQTSPINACYDGGNAGPDLYGNGKWYYHYQPTNWTIGNYQLGTREEFISLCEAAEEYGIKVIVDVAPNHTTTTTEAIEQSFIDAVGGMDRMYHSDGMTTIVDYGDRTDCTLRAVGGLYDVNTENPAFQDYFMAFLNDCIACGADGFRYDTAKHIGLNDDPQDDASLPNNFWERVTTEVERADELFTYGEVLQDGKERIADYIDVIGATTASLYGNRIRNAFVGKFLDAANLVNNDIGDANPDIVTWVESHDNYTSDETGKLMDNEQVKLAYAFLAARSTGTPLFFARPYGATKDNMWGTFNKIGMAGDTLYKDKVVVTANRFRNAMVGLEEEVFNPEDNKHVVCVERGTKGLFLINLDDTSYTFDVATNLENGEYIDRYDGDIYTVKKGKLTGTLEGKSVAALYKEGYVDLDTPAVVKVADDTEGQIIGETLEVTLVAEHCDEAFYTINDGPEVPFENGDVIIIGEEIEASELSRLTLTAQNSAGNKTCISYIFAKQQPISEGTTIYFQKPDNWGDKIFAYVYDESSYDYTKQNRIWPGIEMTLEDNGLYSYTFTDEFAAPLVIFNDKTHQSNGTLEPGHVVEADKVYVVN